MRLTRLFCALLVSRIFVLRFHYDTPETYFTRARAAGCYSCACESSRGKKKRKEKDFVREGGHENYLDAGSDYYRFMRRRLRGCAIIEGTRCISDNNRTHLRRQNPPLLSSPPLPSFSSLGSFRSGADARCVASHTTVLGRKPLSHLITDDVVNNGDDAQEIPRSPAIYKRRDNACIADADDR